MSLKIKFLGGVRTVTGSMHLLETNKSRVLIDCGLFQGRRDDYYRINSHFSFDPHHLDALILSHAHIDHSGNIPNLVKRGFSKTIYATKATADLCNLMLLDSAHIQEEDIKFVNKINKRKGLPSRKPLYTIDDAKTALQYFKGQPYHQKIQITEDISCVFYDAGHILGSSIVFITIKEGQKTINLAYAVDLGREDMPILRDPDILPHGKINYLILESTYGGRFHDDINNAKGELAKYVNMAAEQKGKVIVIVRDPRLTILSWKTTFKALKATTETQCNAWNLIAKTILSTNSDDILIIRLEDLISNQTKVIKNIENYLKIKVKFRKPLFKIKHVSFNSYLKIKSELIPNIDAEIKKIQKLCGKVAKNFGYSNIICK